MPNRSAPYRGAEEHIRPTRPPVSPAPAVAGAWLQMRSVTKIYPDGALALDGVDLLVREKEIHGLLGENGAGKSTLMKILSGILPLTAGYVSLGGREISLHNTREALANGIGMVHQHFSLVSVFTALDNIILGRGAVLARPDRVAGRVRIERLMEETGLHVPLDVPIEQLPVGTRQRVEILKILDRNIDILILDEPTAVLTPHETDQLFHVLRTLAERGATIILITHKLREVLAVTDRVTVLRRGRGVGSRDTKGATATDLARMMVGSEQLPTTILRQDEVVESAPVLSVDRLYVNDQANHTVVRDVSFEVQSGEIFAIAGVTGNGQTELIDAITGLTPISSGTVLLQGQSTAGKNPRQLYRMGLAHVPEDRQRVGMAAEFNVLENSVLGVHYERRFRRALPGTLHWGKVRRYARDLVERFDVLTPNLSTAMRSLSGGNQQKLVVGRELGKSPTLVVAGQPTRGLDVSAAAAIRDLLVDIRNQGEAVLLVSADLDEVLSLADRIAVMYEGRILSILSRGEFDRERIGLLMGGVGDETTAG